MLVVDITLLVSVLCCDQGPPLLTLSELVKIALDVANGARYLETQHFVHR